MSATFYYSLVAVIFLLLVMEVPSHGMARYFYHPEVQNLLHSNAELNLPGKTVTIAFTPFDDNGKLNLATVPKLAKYYADNNLKNILIMGYSSEGAIIRMRERKALVAAWVEQGRCLGLNIIVEVGLQPFVDTLSLASYCSKQNVSAISHIPEQVYKAENIEEAVEDLRKVSEAAPNLPLLYNELLVTAPEISTDAMFLAGDQVPTFVGVQTTINTYFDIEAVTSKGNKNIWIYEIQYTYGAFLLGLTSITVAPNLFPSTVKAMEDAANNCDRVSAKKLQDQLNSWIAAIGNLDGGTINRFARTYFTNLKAAFQIITGINVGARVPFDKANSTVYDQIASNLKSHGILSNKRNSA